MGTRAPEFWITIDQMRDEGLPKTVDYLRFQKGAEDVPFFCIHTDDAFLNQLCLDNIEWPEDIPAAATATTLSKKLPGIYKMIKAEAPPELALDENGKELPSLSGNEALLRHLRNMEKQQLDYDADERTFRKLASRKFLEQQQQFVYNENIPFSILKLIAASNPEFPQEWNLDNIQGPLKACCSGNGGLNEILGVSSAMIYAGKYGSYSICHVEDLDYSSASLMFPKSAGKAWFGIHPDDQHILDAHVSTKYRKRCPSPFLHRDLMIDVDLLQSLGIRWYYFIQRPGDIIVTNPAGPHQVVNLGYNLCEATNFYVHRHLVAARRRKACTCESRLRLYDDAAWKNLRTFVYSGEFKFLCASNGIPFLSPDEAAARISQAIRASNEPPDSRSAEDQMPNQTFSMTNALLISTLQNDQTNGDSGPTVSCEIIETSPLNLANIMSPVPSPIECRQPTPDRNREPSATVEVVYPLESAASKAVSQLLEFSNLFESSQSDAPPPSRKRKRPPLHPLLQTPDRKARLANTRADYWSQRRYEEGQQKRDDVSTSRRRHSIHRTLSSDSTIYEPSVAESPIPETPEAESPIPETSEAESLEAESSTLQDLVDPRIETAGKIKKNAATYSKYGKSRAAARENYEKKGPRPARKRSKTSIWFNDYLQRATRRIETAGNKIAEYARRGTQPGTCDWHLKLANATEIKKNLERRRLLHNVLKSMYQYCPEDLQERLDEGYLEKEIFRDFVFFHSEANKELLRASLEAHHADFSYWENVLQNEEAWNAEFGLDKKYRIPCVEFSELEIDVLDFL